MATTIRGDVGRDIPIWIGLVCAVLPYLIHAGFVLSDPTHHKTYFAGEFGFIENVNNLAGLIAIGFLAALFFRTPERIKPWRWFWGLMLFGMVYFIGEEMSWGQHLFRWATPEYWPTIPRQHETNLHNVANPVLTNNLPRTLASAAIAAGLIYTWLSRRKGTWTPFALTNVAIPCALMTLIPPLFFKAARIGLPETGETEEIYMALTVMLFAASLWLRTRNAPSDPVPAV